MKNNFHTRFTVAGRGTFPYDMLRYDECFPVYPDDSNNMNPSIIEHREIELSHTSRNNFWFPTEGRWSSFGWIVTEINRD